MGKGLSVLVMVSLVTAAASAQSFRKASVYQLSQSVKQIRADDFNRDGRPDLAVLTAGHLLIVYGNGDGTLREGTDTAIDATAFSFVVGDLNGDGNPDVVVSLDNPYSSAVLIGRGDGSFAAPVIYSGLWSRCLGDLNGDGKLDMIDALAAADFNHDGMTDVVGVSGYRAGTGTPINGEYNPAFVWFRFGNGDGTFQALRSAAEPNTSPASVLEASMPDESASASALRPRSTSNVVYATILLSDGKGAFTRGGQVFETSYTCCIGAYRSGISSLVVVDLNGDGLLDLVSVIVSTLVTPSDHLYDLKVAAGRAGGQFEVVSRPTLDRVIWAGQPWVADFNADGRVDLLFAATGIDPMPSDEGGTTSPSSFNYTDILSGDGKGSFTASWSYSGGFVGLAPIDLNADGRLDLAVATNGGIAVLLNDPSAPIVPASITTKFWSPTVESYSTAVLSIGLRNGIGPPVKGLSFTDVLPEGLVVADQPTLANSCGGEVSATGGTVTLRGGAVGAGCGVTLRVKPTSGGMKTNTVTLEGGAGNTASASIEVLAPVQVTAVFSPNVIEVNGTSTLTITVTNPNPISARQAIGVTQYLAKEAGGLSVETVDGVRYSCGGPTTLYSFGFSVPMGTMGPGQSCTITAKVVATTPGMKECTTFAYDNFGPLMATMTSMVTVVPRLQPQTGWWWDSGQNGMGLFLERRNNKILIGGLAYNLDGTAAWMTSEGAMTSSSYSGELHMFSGGQSLIGPYRAPVDLYGFGMSFTVQFTSETDAIVSWFDHTFRIHRFVFNDRPVASIDAETGWWWNPKESGRLFAIEEQGEYMWIGLLGFDDAGAARWYLATNPASRAKFTGNWQEYADGPTFSGCNPFVVCRDLRLKNPNAGAVSVTFQDKTHGTLTLPDGREIPIEHFNF